MKGVRIREELCRQGWPRRYFRGDESAVRLDEKDQTPGFVPWYFWQRLFAREAFFPIEQLLTRGMGIYFIDTLHSEIFFNGYAERFVSTYEPTYVHGRKMFDGSTDDKSLPLNEWLTVEDVGGYDFVVSGKHYWLVSHLILTYISQVKVRVSSE